MLDIFGVKIDLGELIPAPLDLAGQLDELRERLKQAGGEEALSDEQWWQGGTSIKGLIRTPGVLGHQEFYIGTLGKHRRRASRQATPEAPEVVEPPVHVFDDAEEATIVAGVPGITLDDVNLTVEEGVFYLETRPTARRKYRKGIPLDGDPDPKSLQANCHNGVLEVRSRKRKQGQGG